MHHDRDAIELPAGPAVTGRATESSRISDEICALDATEQQSAIREGALTAVRLLEAHLDRIERINPIVNAIVSIDSESAFAAADRADRAWRYGAELGMLHGIPLAVKDLMDTAGLRTTYGSPIYAEHVPVRDSLLAERLRGAGGIIFGKTNVPEFGAGSHTFNAVFGPTRNPWDTARSAGGSSGGAGAALAARLLAVADGSDLGGSIRNPASYANLFGLRPTAGRVASARPGDAYDPASVLGPLARNVGDLALLLDAMAGPDPRAPLSLADERPFVGTSRIPLDGARIAFTVDLGNLPVDDAVVAVMGEVRQRLVDGGAVVVDVELPLEGADFSFEALRSLDFLESYGADVAAHPSLVKDAVKDDVRWGSELRVDQILRARADRTRLYRGMQELFTRFDLAVAPTSQLPPFDIELEFPTVIAGAPLERYYEWQRSCSRITATGMPVLAAPGGFTSDGLPVGVQFIGPARSERRLLGFGLSWQDLIADLLLRRPSLAA